MTRKEHLDWCKQRANEYIDRADIQQAFLSMVSDLGKHDETRNHPAIRPGTSLYLGGHLSSVEKMREFINGFN